MKTPDDIKKGLNWCIRGGTCFGCPYESDCYDGFSNKPLSKDALDYIQELEAGLAQWGDVIESPAVAEDIARENSHLADTIRSLTKQLDAAHEETAKALRERDAAVYALESIATGRESKCAHCVHSSDRDCFVCWGERWQWRGVCPENTEVQEDE